MIDYSKYRDPAEYPAGIQDFLKLRNGHFLYVDKTALMYEMTRTPFVFLSRPRRFGKSLLCSTLKYYFEGRSELFEGLAIMDLEKEWTEYPVLHFSISSLKDKPIDMMADELGSQLEIYEEKYGPRNPGHKTPGSRLRGLIMRAHEITGKPAVVIIDEYDAPILQYMHDEENLPKVRQIMQEFYQTLKECDADERFVFITGITKFSQLSIFSTINNLTNISLTDRFSSLCGISESELHSVFDNDVEMLSEEYEVSKEQMYVKLKDMYNGYHFSKRSEEVYNPYSLIRAFYHRELQSFWFASGTPTFIINELKKNGGNILKYDGALARDTEFDQPTENMKDAKPLLYQAGYLTIKKYSPLSHAFTLGIPNSEVKAGLMENLLPIVCGTCHEDNASYATMIVEHLANGDYDKAMATLQSFLSSIPYMQQGKDYLKDLAPLEAFYQRDLYIFFCGMSATVRCEVMMADGRTDMVMYLGDRLFLFEFKIAATAKSALDQIDRRKYYEPWLTQQRTIITCGARFDVKDRTLKDWEFKELGQ